MYLLMYPTYVFLLSAVQKCRCYCVWYTVLFTILCSVAIAVWTAAISPSKKLQNYVTSLDEVMKVDANRWVTVRMVCA